MKLSEFFGRNLKLIRENKKLTQQELAELCELHPTTIGMYEIGKRAPSFKTAEILAEKLGVSFADLFDESVGCESSASESKLIKMLYKEISTLDKETLKYVLDNVKLLKKLVQK